MPSPPSRPPPSWPLRCSPSAGAATPPIAWSRWRAVAGALADLREIAALTGLEFLELGPDDWRSLLTAGAVPRSLLAAAVHTRGQDQSAADAVVTDLLALF